MYAQAAGGVHNVWVVFLASGTGARWDNRVCAWQCVVEQMRIRFRASMRFDVPCMHTHTLVVYHSRAGALEKCDPGNLKH